MLKSIGKDNFVKKLLRKVYRSDGQDRLLPRLVMAIFDRYRTVALIWLALTIFGVASYTTLLQREGFPSVNIPFSTISGAYIVNDPQKVDKEVAKPISDIVLQDERVKSVQSQALATFYNVAVQYEEGTNADKAGQEIAERIKQANVLPQAATFKAETPKFGFTQRGDDMVVSVYAKERGASPQELLTEAEKVAAFIEAQDFADIESISAINPFVNGTDPTTGQAANSRTTFDRYGIRQGDENVFFDSVAVGIMQKGGTDVIELDAKIDEALARYNQQNSDSPFTSVLSASFAHDIQDQISELQRALLEGLLAVLIIGSIVIAVRASIITILAMLTVLAITLGVLLAIGYTLNTITLFSLILCLALIVDDTIIMIEAIDAQRRRRKDPRETVKVATRKVSRAMVAATLTAALSFAPLLFVGGILGSFIRAIPVTVITSLLVSLLVALIFIPLFARYIILGKKQMGAKNVHEPAAKVEEKIAAFIGKPMLWARGSKKKLLGVGVAAVLVGFTFIGAGLYLFGKVTFNIFPPTKDSNGLSVEMAFAPGTTIEQAEAVADKASQIVGQELGENFRYASTYANASARDAVLYTYLIPYTEREVRSPQLAERLNKKFEHFAGARVNVRQSDVGPPPSSFNVQIKTEDREAAMKLARDIEAFLLNKELVRISGEKAKVTETSLSDPGTYARSDGDLYLGVTANFDGTDTSTLVTLAQQAVEDEFSGEKLASYGLGEDVLGFDIGQEQENQESFATLAIAFPILLLAIYVLLAVQFRSLAQPLLIFMAIPFSLFGVTLGLYLTDNAFSFFAMLGFFALIGLSLKNTILLTDYANQLRGEGKSAVDAAVGALAERFRPLIATSFTAVVSLIPLMLSSPFWEGLAVVLIFGLLSNTLLVVLVFPYYYLGAEFVRLRVSRKAGLLWVGGLVAGTVAFSFAVSKQAGLFITAYLLGTVALLIGRALARRRARARS